MIRADATREDVARHRLLSDDHARGCVFLLRVRSGLEDAAAKRLLRDTLDDSGHVANLPIDADSLLEMDNYVREVRPLSLNQPARARTYAHDKNAR